MKNIFLIAMLLFFMTGCKKESVRTEPMYGYTVSKQNIGGIDYDCIQVGQQLWMAENLRTRLEGGKADGCMTYREASVGDPAKADLKELLIALLETPVFGTDMMDLMMIDYVINGMIIPDYMESKGYYFRDDWETYSKAFRADLNNAWALVYFDKVELEYVALEQREKNKLVEAAADKDYARDYGYLYTYEAAQKVVPEGWRIPSDQDWKQLELRLGMSETDLDKLDTWRGDVGAWFKTSLDRQGFNAKMGGGYVYGTYLFGDNYIYKGNRAYWWSATKAMQIDTTNLYITRSVSFDRNEVLRGTSREDAAYHLRLVRNLP